MYLNQPLPIVPEEEFPAAIVRIEEELSSLRHEGYFTGDGAGEIYYEYFLAQDPVGSVVFVHGLSEFTKKYHEFAHYFLNEGYNVFLYDQRGHGKSHRDVSRPELIHINSVDQLVADLDAYIETVVRPASSAPLYLYAHSFGGAVGILYLAKHGSRFQKAVLTSPLFMPRMNDLPAWPFLISTAIGQVLRGPKAKFLFSGEYEIGNAYNPTPGDSPNRVRHCLACRDQEPMYRSTPMTVGCVRHTMKLRRRLLKKQVTGAIQIPTLMLCADTDVLVRTKYQTQFAERCPGITYRQISNANHALHTDNNEALHQTLIQVFRFFST